jgi:hypothetical protein
MKKYYILKRTSNSLINNYLMELPKERRDKIDRKIDATLPLLLIEKTINKGVETHTNLWTIGEGVESLWTVHTKGRLMYDYTGVVSPLIHNNGTVLTWEQYNNLGKS